MTPLDPTAAPKASPAPLLKPPQSGAGLGNLTQLLAAQLQQEQQSAPAAARRPAVQASQAELGTKLAQSAPNAATGARRPVSGSSWSFAGQAASGKGKEIPRSLNEALTVVGQNASMFDEYDEERRPDGSVSMQDLEAIAADESLPQHVRVAAALLYDSEDQAKSQFYGEPGTFDLQEVQAFSEASATLQTVLLRERNLSAAKLSPAELAAVNEQLVAQSQDPNAVRLVKNGDALLQQLNEPYLQTLTSVSGGVEAQTSAIAAENEHFTRMVEELKDVLPPGQLQKLTDDHEARLETLEADLAASAREFVAMAQDPMFQAAFAGFPREKQEAFLAGLVTVDGTDAGSALGDLFAVQLAKQPPEGPYARAAVQLAQEGSQSVDQSLAVLAGRQLLGGGQPNLNAFFDIAGAVLPEGELAEIRATMDDMRAAQVAGDDAAYRRLRGTLGQKVRDASGSSSILSVGALALDAVLIGKGGLSVLQDDQFALEMGNHTAETAATLMKVFGAGKTAIRLMTAVGAGMGAIATVLSFVSGGEQNAVSKAGGVASLIGYGLVAFGSGGAGALLVGVGAALGLVGDALQVSEYHKFVDGALQDADIPPAVGAYASWTPDAQDLVVQFAVQHQMSVQKAFLLLHDAYSKLVATGTPRPVMADTVKVAISSIENDVPVPSGGGGQRAHFR